MTRHIRRVSLGTGMAATLCDTVWRNARLATMAGSAEECGLGVVARGLVAGRDGRIVYVGPTESAPAFAAARDIDCEGRWITPGLVDCHTHIVHAGNRAGEFEERLRGVSYEEIARRGGGILTTVRATRAADIEELAQGAMGRVRQLMGEGVTTLEIKSGYGLTVEDELKMLRAARAIGEAVPLRVTTTLLGAHALPPEYAEDRSGYVDLVVNEMIPAARRGLADAVDAFCERIAFTLEETERVFEAAGRAGLPVKLHADQLSNQRGAYLAARYGALSADHLEHLDEEGAQAMASAGTVAVLLPGAFYFTRETHLPPVELLRRLKIPIALASDCNPGTSPMASVLLAMNMGATLFRLTVEECLLGVTRHGARALGLQGETGVLEAGLSCDLAIWDVESLAELVYRIGANPLHARVYKGVTS